MAQQGSTLFPLSLTSGRCPLGKEFLLALVENITPKYLFLRGFFYVCSKNIMFSFSYAKPEVFLSGFISHFGR